MQIHITNQDPSLQQSVKIASLQKPIKPHFLIKKIPSKVNACFTNIPTL